MPPTVTPDPDTRHIFGYVRVSTNRQETERQHETIPARHATLPDGLADLPLELFYDHGKSAWSGEERPSFDEMLARVRAGDAAALIVDTSSRLTRQGIFAALDILRELAGAGCRLFTTQGKEYGTDLAGIVSLAADAQTDENYSSTLSHNISTGKAAKAREGRWYHGDAPPGYRFNAETKQLEPTDDLPVIAELFRRFNNGATYQALCDYATQRLSDDSLIRRKNSLRTVARDRVRGWLANPLYAGFVPHRGELYDGTHPPAVDLPTFERAQARLRQLSAKRETWAPRGEWPLTGVAKHHCGRSLRRHPVKNRHGQTYYYTRCADPDCAKREGGYTAAAVEANVLLALASSALAVEAILTDDPSWGVPNDGGPTLDEALTARDAARARVKELGELIADGALKRDDPRYQQALRERDAADQAVERIAGNARSYRDELAALAARVLALADDGPEDDAAGHLAEETVTLIGKGTEQTFTVSHNGRPGPTLLQLLDGYQAASPDRRRAALRESLTAAVIGPETTELHFRIGLPSPIVTSHGLAVRGRSADTRELEAVGFADSGVCHHTARQ